MAGQLAEAWRAKYPGAYDNVPDAELEAAIVAKFPGAYDHLLEQTDAEPEPAKPVRQWTGLQRVIDTIDAPASGPTLVGPRVRGFVAGSLQAAADLAEGVKAGAASTVYHGGDLIRRATGMDRIIDDPEVQNVITPPQTGAGRTGFLLEQGGEFAVPLTRLSKITKGMSVPRRMAVDAAASGAVAGVQSGADPAATTTGVVLGGAMPVVGAGLRIVKGAAQRAAAGAAEGGLGGAIAGAVRTAAPLESNFMLFQGLKPRNSRVNFMRSLERAVPEIKAAETELGKPIESLDDLLTATGLTKKRIRAQYDAIAGPKRTIGTTVDLSPVADEMVTRIPKKLRLERPSQVEAIEEIAGKYRRAFTLEEAEQLLKETNAELEAFYNKFPLGQRRALVADPEAMRLTAQADGIRKAIYATLDAPGQDNGAKALNRLYGDLIEIEDTAVRRANVAKRQQPESLNEQFAQASAAGDLARGAWRIARGDFMGAADVAAGRAKQSTAKFLKEQQTTDALIRRAFAGVKAKPGVYAKPVQRPVRGLIERGATPMPSSTADPSGRIPATLPENYERTLRDQAEQAAFESSLDDVLPKAGPAAVPDAAERSFMLRWLADDLREMPFQESSRMRGARAVDEWQQRRHGDPDTRYAPRVAGTPTQEMFHALGIKGTRAEIAAKLDKAIRGEGDPKFEALADAMREAFDGQRLDWQLVSDQTLAKLGVRRRDLRSPITTPNPDDMPDLYRRLFGGDE